MVRKAKRDVVIDGGLSEVKAHPLTDAEIRKMLGQDIKILTSRDLSGVRRLDDIFDRKGRSVILYTPENPTSGHWVCLLHKGDHIEYFDSYGDPADTPEDLGEVPPYLTPLLRQAGIPVYYNTHQFQKERSDVATCGRWCIARLLYFPYTLDKFAGVVRRFKGDPDDFVSALIYDKLKT